GDARSRRPRDRWLVRRRHVRARGHGHHHAIPDAGTLAPGDHPSARHARVSVATTTPWRRWLLVLARVAGGELFGRVALFSADLHQPLFRLGRARSAAGYGRTPCRACRRRDAARYRWRRRPRTRGAARTRAAYDRPAATR